LTNNKFNSTFFDPELNGIDLRKELDKQEMRTMGSMATKISTAKELNRIKKEETASKNNTLLQIYRNRNISSIELSSLMRHE